jgi:hypothetical protein
MAVGHRKDEEYELKQGGKFGKIYGFRLSAMPAGKS